MPRVRRIRFQVGVGANEKSGNYDAAGCLDSEHTTLSGAIGDRDVHWYGADFLMDLTLERHQAAHRAAPWLGPAPKENGVSDHCANPAKSLVELRGIEPLTLRLPA